MISMPPNRMNSPVCLSICLPVCLPFKWHHGRLPYDLDCKFYAKNSFLEFLHRGIVFHNLLCNSTVFSRNICYKIEGSTKLDVQQN